MIAQFFANNKPPPTPVAIAEAKSEVIPNLLTAVGDLAAVHQVNVTSDVCGRITDIMFTAGATVKAGSPLVQLFDGPDQGDLASFKAQATGAQLALDRAKQLAARQFGPQATVDAAQAAYDTGQRRHRQDRSDHFAEAGARAVRRRARRPPCRGRPVSHRGHADRDADRPVAALCQLHGDGKGQRDAQGRADRARAVDAYPGKIFEGKITTIEPQITTDTRNIRVQATMDNPDHILKPGMFATTTVVLPDKPPVVTVPETAVDYTLYGDSVFLITEKKEDDGKTSLTAVRTFVRTGNRIDGSAEILSGVKAGDRVVAVGQLKLQSGAAVSISTDPPPPIPANPPRY